MIQNSSVVQNTYPAQRISYAQKNPKWRQANVSFFISRANLGYSMDRTEYTGVSRSANRNRIYNMLINYDIYNGRFLKSDIEYIINPFGQDESQTFPTTPQNINIVRPAIDYLIGEKATKSSKFMVLDTSPEMVDAMTELKKNMIVQNIIAETQNFIDPESQEETIPMDKIDQYVHYTHKNIYEKAGQFMLNTLRSKLGMDEEFIEAWKDSLIGGENCFYVGYLAGEPLAERVNPCYIDFERHPDMNKIDEADWLVRKMYMSPSKIFNTWKLDATEMDHLSLSTGMNILGGPGDDMAPFIRKRMSEDMYMTTDTLPVYHVVGQSLQDRFRNEY